MIAPEASQCHEKRQFGTHEGDTLAYSFPDAGRRDWTDAKHLAADDRFQNAGHLLGLAAECLAKEVLERAGIITDKSSAQQWSHFPKIARDIRMDARTRAMIPLLPILANSKFLDGWQVECRYEVTMPGSAAETRYRSWRADVDKLFNAAGIP